MPSEKTGNDNKNMSEQHQVDRGLRRKQKFFKRPFPITLPNWACTSPSTKQPIPNHGRNDKRDSNQHPVCHVRFYSLTNVVEVITAHTQLSCRRQFSRYTCPKCNIPYCSLICFRSVVCPSPYAFIHKLINITVRLMQIARKVSIRRN